MLFLDGLLHALLGAIVVLLFTGGAQYASPGLKLELSQVDAFAWAAFGLMAVRRWRTGAWLSPWLERATTRALAWLDRNPRLALGGAVALYVVLYTWVSAWRFASYHASAFDLGYVDQSLWSTTRVGFLHCSLARGGTYLGEHFSPMLGAVALLYRVCDSVYALFFAQSCVLASGAALVYLLALQKKAPRAIAVLAALGFLAYQPLRAANTFDFREDDLFVPVFLGMLLSLERKRWSAFWGLAIASWLIKENAPIFTALTGAWIFLGGWRRGQAHRAQGVALAALSAAAFLVINTKVTPHFSGITPGAGAETMLVRRLHQFGSSNEQILRYILLHPFAFVAEVGRPLYDRRALKYVLDVSVPFLAFVPAAPLAFAVAAAGMLMNLVVNQPTIGFHYECVLIPFLFYVLASGLGRLEARGRFAKPHYAALVALSFLLFFGRSPIEAIRRYQPTAHDGLLSQELAKIPATASVATQAALYPHLSHRRDIFLFAAGMPPADYIAVDLSPDLDRYATPALEVDVARIDPKIYESVFDRDYVKVWRKK